MLDGREPRPVRDGDVVDDRHVGAGLRVELVDARAAAQVRAAICTCPCCSGALEGFDVVYSSHLWAYGSVPVTLHQAPGARIETFVTLVDDEQLVRLAETEFNYALHRLDGARFSGAEIEVDAPIAFVSRHGALGIEGDPIRLVDRTQREMLERVRAYLAPDEPLEDFIVAQRARPRARGGVDRGAEGAQAAVRAPADDVLDV